MKKAMEDLPFQPHVRITYKTASPLHVDGILLFFFSLLLNPKAFMKTDSSIPATIITFAENKYFLVEKYFKQICQYNKKNAIEAIKNEMQLVFPDLR